MDKKVLKNIVNSIADSLKTEDDRNELLSIIEDIEIKKPALTFKEILNLPGIYRSKQLDGNYLLIITPGQQQNWHIDDTGDVEKLDVGSWEDDSFVLASFTVFDAEGE